MLDLATSRIAALTLAAGMGAAALAYASLLLYQSFSSTPAAQSQSANSAPEYRVSVKFDASVGSGMPWIFDGPRNAIQVPLGH